MFCFLFAFCVPKFFSGMPGFHWEMVNDVPLKYKKRNNTAVALFTLTGLCRYIGLYWQSQNMVTVESTDYLDGQLVMDCQAIGVCA